MGGRLRYGTLQVSETSNGTMQRCGSVICCRGGAGWTMMSTQTGGCSLRALRPPLANVSQLKCD